MEIIVLMQKKKTSQKYISNKSMYYYNKYNIVLWLLGRE